MNVPSYAVCELFNDFQGVDLLKDFLPVVLGVQSFLGDATQLFLSPKAINFNTIR